LLFDDGETQGGVPAAADSPSPAAAPAAEDDDSWLTSAAEDLEKQMQQREKELDAYMQKVGAQSSGTDWR
jgi:ABC-type transport system involved in cytochrome bd biosynthesis fused ATPase/permease subunit